MVNKTDWEKSSARLEAFWEREIIDRCCAAIPVVSGAEYSFWDRDIRPGEDAESYYLGPERIISWNLSRMRQTFYGGDAFPSIFPYFGTAAHSLYLAGSCDYFPETVWIEPAVENWKTTDLVFSPENYYWNRHKAVLESLASLAGEDYFVAPTDNTSVLDAVANLRGPEKLLTDLIDFPDEVKAACRTVFETLKVTAEEIFTIIRHAAGGGFCHSWMYLWAPRRIMQLQCDFSCMISTEMFREFVLPEIEEICSWIDLPVYHLDGREQIRHLDMLLSVPNLRAIQWTPVAGQPPTSDFIPVLRKIQKAGKNLVLLPEAREVETLLDSLSSRGLQLVISDVTSEDEAVRLIENIAQWTRD